jgi:branched-chain amino acid transport system substrate-binding protein
MSGVTADITGKGSVVAAEMAVQEFGGTVLGKPIQVISADHQHKTDVGGTIARRWFDTEGVDVMVDVPNSAVALAVQGLAREKKRLVLFCGSYARSHGSDRLSMRLSTSRPCMLR